MTGSIKDRVKELREKVFNEACEKNMGHIAPSLSCLDIIGVLSYSPEFAGDKIVISKGHGCYALYAIKDKWGTGCLEGFGSLGHGLPIAVGNAFGMKLLGKKGHIWCIVGDGEMQEGSMWEALNFLQHHNLDNISVIIDNNGLQAMDRVENILKHNLEDRLNAWGLETWVCDGHNIDKLYYILKFKPRVLIANTIKGKGYKCMENIPKFHFRIPNDDERFNS